MSEEQLNIEYIREKTGLVENDELIPIILKMIKDIYKAGLCQAEYDNTMDLIEERQELIEYLKSEIKSWKDKIFENTLTEDNFTLALWRSRLITYEKVLNKIEKSDK